MDQLDFFLYVIISCKMIFFSVFVLGNVNIGGCLANYHLIKRHLLAIKPRLNLMKSTVCLADVFLIVLRQ